jgi:hypothetical protein
LVVIFIWNWLELLVADVSVISFSSLWLRWQNQSFAAGIAHPVPSRDLPNAYDKMAAYGRLCFDHFSDFTAQHKELDLRTA